MVIAGVGLVWAGCRYRRMRERLFPQLRTQIQVTRSQVEASALGAAALVWHELAAG